MAESRIPEARDDDPEDVSDKLSIATAMWARGDRADAVNWLRRAAESASDADLDLRALELAKIASELTASFETAVPPPRPPTAAPPAQVTTQAPAAAAPPKSSPTAAPPNKPPPKPSVRPPSSRPPGGKLPPLPPLRPLGSATATPAAAQPKSPRVPSMVSSVSGATSASGTIERSDAKTEAAKEASSPMPWDDLRGDDEPTHQIAISPAKGEAPKPEEDLDSTAERNVVDPQLLRAMKAPAASDRAIRAAAVVDAPPAASEPPPTRLASTPRPSEDGRTTREPPYLPLAVGVRVRLVADESGVRVVPDDGTIDDGTVAILVPTHADDDLRVLFARGR